MATSRVRTALALELRNHRLDADAGAHQVDDLLAQHVLGLFLVETDLVDDRGQAGAREDLRAHDVQALVDVAPLHAGADELLVDRLGLHEDRGVARVDVGQRHRDPIGGQHHQQRGEGGDLGPPANDAGEVTELEVTFNVHGRGSPRRVYHSLMGAKTCWTPRVTR